jgi:hypothetical protein
MEPDNANSRSRFLLRAHPVHWALGALLLLLTLAGYLTSYAAGLPEQAGPATLTATLSLPTASATIPPGETALPAVTLVPRVAVYAFQTTTPTATATATPTPTLTDSPDTATPTPEPTATTTSQPTDTPRPTNTLLPTATDRPPSTRPTASPFQAYAWLDNYYPAPGTVVTVYGRLFRNGRPVNGAQMGATWSYTHGEGYCTAYTGIDGRAACTQNIGAPLQNYWVYVDVVFVYEDELYYAKTGFVTDP